MSLCKSFCRTSVFFIFPLHPKRSNAEVIIIDVLFMLFVMNANGPGMLTIANGTAFCESFMPVVRFMLGYTDLLVL